MPEEKTRHQGKPFRVIPIFPELRPLLEQAFELAAAEAVHVITRYRQPNANLRTQFERILRRAGVEPWTRLFQNLRASRETELAGEYPLHVVTAWLGNTERVASKHYLQVTDAHFEDAQRVKSDAVDAVNVSKPTPCPVASFRTVSPEIQSLSDVALQVLDSPNLASSPKVPPRGVEPLFPD